MVVKIIDRYIRTDVGIAKYSDKKKRYRVLRKGNRVIDLHKAVYIRKYKECPPKMMEIHHIDGNKFNNHYDNLVLVTTEEHQWIHQNMEKASYSVRVIENTIKDAKSHKKIKLTKPNRRNKI